MTAARAPLSNAATTCIQRNAAHGAHVSCDSPAGSRIVLAPLGRRVRSSRPSWGCFVTSPQTIVTRSARRNAPAYPINTSALSRRSSTSPAQPVVSLRAAAIMAAMSAVSRGAADRGVVLVASTLVSAESAWRTASFVVGEGCRDMRWRSAIAASQRRRVVTA